MSQTLTVIELALRLLSTPGAQRLLELYAAKQITANELRDRINELPDPPEPRKKDS